MQHTVLDMYTKSGVDAHYVQWFIRVAARSKPVSDSDKCSEPFNPWMAIMIILFDTKAVFFEPRQTAKNISAFFFNP